MLRDLSRYPGRPWGSWQHHCAELDHHHGRSDRI